VLVGPDFIPVWVLVLVDFEVVLVETTDVAVLDVEDFVLVGIGEVVVLDVDS